MRPAHRYPVTMALLAVGAVVALQLHYRHVPEPVGPAMHGTVEQVEVCDG